MGATRNIFDKNDYQEWEDLMQNFGISALDKDRKGRFGERVFGLPDDANIFGYKFRPANALLGTNDMIQHLAPYIYTGKVMGKLPTRVPAFLRSALTFSTVGGLTEVIDPELRKDFDF